MKKVYNFSPGPSVLPKEVMLKAKKEFNNFNNSGFSILEISHRDKSFIKIIRNSEKIIRELLLVPDNYSIIFCHGGARGQFSAIPMNLFHSKEKVDYIISGYWSKLAAQEAKKYCLVNEIDIREFTDKEMKLKSMEMWKLTKDSKYVHYCPNETIDGVAIHPTPSCFYKKIFIADYSSSILSHPINIKSFGVIYAGFQKNIGPSGTTLVIIKNDLLENVNYFTPSILNYSLQNKNQSMYNTPTTFSIYLAEMVLKWIKKKGGLKRINIVNQNKSKILYETIDKNNCYINKISQKNRSIMNIVFHMQSSFMENLFLKEARKNGLFFLEGHRKKGGIRASIYNAMPISGVKKLSRFMKKFAIQNY
ncbi:3-phosphoserine/phosphohydroxythreonine aminotransferase [Candidatus Riesia sp. GBBU]|nr:3-phosphoserine/phosphohydroxythreonine aminotransferase [Candidatus Riesia sp. GBBU]